MEVITEGDYESSLEYFDGKFNELADYFVDSHFVNRKEIKWKEIYDLININHITDKFEQMLGNNPHFVNDENRTYFLPKAFKSALFSSISLIFFLRAKNIKKLTLWNGL